MSKWKVEFEARSPKDPDHETWSVGIHEAYFERLRRQNHLAPFARIILLVKDVLANTRWIYAGWSRPEKEDCLVYVGQPPNDYRSASIVTPPPPNMSFLVFVLK